MQVPLVFSHRRHLLRQGASGFSDSGDVRVLLQRPVGELSLWSPHKTTPVPKRGEGWVGCGDALRYVADMSDAIACDETPLSVGTTSAACNLKGNGDCPKARKQGSKEARKQGSKQASKQVGRQTAAVAAHRQPPMAASAVAG